MVCPEGTTDALPPMTAKKMLVKATAAIRPNAPTDTKANPAREYSSAANEACSTQQQSVVHIWYSWIVL